MIIIPLFTERLDDSNEPRDALAEFVFFIIHRFVCTANRKHFCINYGAATCADKANPFEFNDPRSYVREKRGFEVFISQNRYVVPPMSEKYRLFSPVTWTVASALYLSKLFEIPEEKNISCKNISLAVDRRDIAGRYINVSRVFSSTVARVDRRGRLANPLAPYAKFETSRFVDSRDGRGGV